MTESRGELFDIGYQRYNGPRQGRWRARHTLWLNGLRTALGIGRGTRAKVLPVLLFLAVIGPALIMTLVASLAPAEDLLGPGGYYQVVGVLVLIFAAIVAPELVCPDRRDKVLHLYLVRPITPLDYIGSRWAAFFTVSLFFLYIGQVVLFAGMLLAADDQWQYIRDNWLDVPKVLAAGAVIAAFTTSLPMAVAAFTVRRAYAAAFIIGIFIVSGTAAGQLMSCRVEQGFTRVEPVCEPVTGERGRWLALLDVSRIPITISDMVFDEDNENLVARQIEALPDFAPVGWYLLAVAGSMAVLVRRYTGIAL